MAQTKEISLGDTGARAANAHSNAQAKAVAADETVAEVNSETMALNVGPSHPTTHGVLRLMMELDGDLIKNVSRSLVTYTEVMRNCRKYDVQSICTLHRSLGLFGAPCKQCSLCNGS